MVVMVAFTGLVAGIVRVAGRRASASSRPPRWLDAPPRGRRPDRHRAELRGAADRRGLTAAAAATLLASGGVALMAAADEAARRNVAVAEPLYWVALLVIVLPLAVVACAREVGPQARLLALVALGLGLYAVKVVHSPDGFTFNDELQTLRSVRDLDATGRLFVENPLVRSYPYYPALSSTTVGLAQITGLPISVAGLCVIGAARVVAVVALFALYRGVAESDRVAAIATIVYATNPNFLYFDGQFAYESLALPLALLALVAVVRLDDAHRRRRPAIAAGALLVTAGVIVAHHLSAWWLAAMLIALALVSVVIRGVPLRRRVMIAVAAALSTALVAAWYFGIAGAATRTELGPTFRTATDAVVELARGRAGTKPPFSAAPGRSDPVLEKLVGLGSVALLGLALLIGLWQVVRVARRRRSPLTLVLALLALTYPATLVLRLTQAGTEASNRSAEFVFVGLGLVVALAAIAVADWIRSRGPAVARLPLPLGLAGLAVLLAGGITIGFPPFERQPGPYLVGQGSRSVSAEGKAAATFAAQSLPPRSRIATDAGNRLLMLAYGGMNPQAGIAAGLAVPDVFFSPTYDPVPRAIVAADKLAYLVVDLRLSRQTSATGTYYDREEPLARQRTTPVDPAALAKFDDVPGLARIYDGGDIRIFGTGEPPVG